MEICIELRIHSLSLLNGKDKNLLLTVVFTSTFLILIGLFTHNVFADSVVTTIQMPMSGPLPIDVNPQTNMIYVGNVGTINSHGTTVTAIDGATNSVVKTTRVLASPFHLAVNPNTNLIYVPIESGGVVDVIDGSTNSVVNEIYLGCCPLHIAANPDTNKIYVDNGTLQVLDGSTNKVVSTITIDNPSSSAIGNIAVNPNTNKIYVANYGYTRSDNAVTVIDGSTDSIICTIPVGQAPASTIAVNPTTDKIYVANDTGVVVIDGSTNTMVDKILGVKSDGGIAVNPVTNKIYVVSESGNTTSVIDGTTDTVSSTITGLRFPYGVAVNPVTNTAYVTNWGDSTVTVIQGGSEPDATSQIQVNSQDSSGNELTGYYTELYAQNGTQIDSGYTPNSFTLDNGQIYTVHVENYGNFKFNHWQDTGSTDANRTISITSDQSITAVYATIPTHPSNLTATAVSPSEIDLSWNAPSSDGGSPVTGYRIQISTDGSTWTTIVKNTGNTNTAYSDTSLSADTTYYYRVFALNSVGSSYRSNIASATTPMINVAGVNVGPAMALP